MPDSLAFYFGFVAKGTVCEGARLEHTFLPARLRCSACGMEWDRGPPVFRCPAGDDVRVAVVSGHEFEIESIDVGEDEVYVSRP
ncbi:MAG: hydrogenase maturation nickel metallochaperone HypA [Gemmatimonadetes bacterium]|nr:hydrogenase maturation nickel metallochaperone HypA [Gemmatimonadota bacterium]